jgi:hypothetical protein
MTTRDTKEDLRVLETEQIKESVIKVQDDPMAMSLLVAYAQSLEQTRRARKKEADKNGNDPEPGQKAS